MYLKFNTELDFISLARVLIPEVCEENLGFDAENEYEWMYVDLPIVPFSLNVSRKHGWEEDDWMTESEDQQPATKITPGPVYVFGWERSADDYVDDLPHAIATYIADRLGSPVEVYAARINVSVPDLEPVETVEPRTRHAE